MHLSIQQIKQLLPLGGYVDHRGKNYYTKCPKCGVDEFGVSLAPNHQFACFRKKRCGFRGNIFTLLRYLGKTFDIHDDRLGKRLIVEFQEVHNDINLDLQTISYPIGWEFIESHPYLENRNFNSYGKFNPGISTDPRLRDYVIFPIYSFGDLKGYVGRHTWSKEQIEQYNIGKESNQTIKRYRNSETDFAKILLGIDEVTDETTTLILVEGIFDKEATDRKLKLDNIDDTKCACTFKCGLSPEQLYQVLQTNINKIILLYDPDVIKEIKQNGLYIEQFISNVLIAFNDYDFKDPADTKVDLNYLIERAKSPTTFATSKVFAPILR